MRYYLFSFLFCFVFATSASNLDSDLNKAYDLLDVNLDSAAILANQILEYSLDDGDLYGQVQANFILGYITKLKKEYGVSVIYYLEAIRKAESADYEKVDRDRISLRKNIANTFRQFRANGLATQYNLEAIKIAEETNNIKQLIDLKLNQGYVYQDNGEYDLAISMFEDLLAISTSEYKLDAINEIGITYLKQGKFDQSEEYFRMLVDLSPKETNLYAKALHNLGEIEYENDNIHLSIENLRDAIVIFNSVAETEPDYFGLFNTYRNLGLYLFYTGENTEAREYLHESLELMEYAKHDPSSFEAYKILSNLYYSIGDQSNGKIYQEEYFKISQEFMELQQDIQQKDKEYNFELIAKRYFDDIEKQDRLASVMMYSKVSIGSLIFILILVITYFYSEKLRMRKSIEKELKSLKILK